MRSWPFKVLRNEALRSLLSPLTRGRASALIRPTIAAVYLTKFCNSRCTMCDFWKQARDHRELTSEDWGGIFARLKAFGVGFVGINASGEMFTRPDVFDILGHLRDLNLLFGVNTNGTLLSRDYSRKLAALKPCQVTIGLDGIGDESYAATRGLKNGFSTVLTNLEHIKDAGIGNIYIGTVLMRDNLHDWMNICHFALDKKLSGVRFTAYQDRYFNPQQPGKQIISSETGFITQVEAEIYKLLDLQRKTGIVKNSEEYLRRVPDFYRAPGTYFPVPCLQGSNRIEIDVYGNVTLCSFMTEPLGNLLRDEMERIWRSDRHRHAREQAALGRCHRCFLSCYAEENLRLAEGNIFSTLSTTIEKTKRVFGSS